MQQSGHNALFWASRYGYTEIVKLLDGGPSTENEVKYAAHI